MADASVERWTGWVDGPIYANVTTMHLHRGAWRQVQQILVANGTLPDSYWWEFMTDTYATTQAAAVRRQLDTRRGVASLGRLLLELRTRPRSLSREHWLSLWDGADEFLRAHVAPRTWTEEAGGGAYIDADIVAADIEALNVAAADVKAYVDEHVAHTKARPHAVSVEVTVTLTAVHDAVEIIGETFRRYYLLLTASGLAQLEPVIQHDWLAVFCEPWIKSPDVK